MSFIFRKLFSTSPAAAATMDAAKTKAQQLIDENAVSKFDLPLPKTHSKAKAG
jgi:glutaredoxin 3